MKNRYVIFLIFILGILTIAKLYQPSKRKPTHLHVVCSTTILADALTHIAGGAINLKTLMGPGIDPHLYRARESDVAALCNADIIFYHGLQLEGKMGEIFDHMSSYANTIAVAQAFNKQDLLQTEFPEIYDPHVWHDVSLWLQVIPVITNALCKSDPKHAEMYAKNAESYVEELKQLDKKVEALINQIPDSKKCLITAHDAFAYYGKRYGLRVIGLQGISTDSQVSISDIKQAVGNILKYKVPAIFLESSIPAQSVCAVQRAVHAKGHTVAIAPELFSDSLGDQSGTADSYCGMILHNTEVIVSALTQ